MDIFKQDKPMHIVCPKCKAELAYNPRTISEQLESLGVNYNSLCRYQGQAVLNEKEKNRVEKLKKRISFKIKLLKKDKNMLSKLANELSKKRLLELLKNEVGEQRFIELRDIAEQEFCEDYCYHTYELAIQRYSNILDN